MKIVEWLLNLVLSLAALVAIWLFGQIVLFTSFRIPSDSMEPVMEAGDCILVNKLSFGARLFDIFASMRNEQVEIYRIPGFRKPDRNDVLVFNFPHPNDWSKIEMHIMKYYIKRCIGLPGDTLSINNGFYHVNGYNGILGNQKDQQYLSTISTQATDEKVFNSYPDSTIIDWSIKNYGPLYIPKKGDTLKLTIENCIQIRKWIRFVVRILFTSLTGMVIQSNNTNFHETFTLSQSIILKTNYMRL